MEVAPCHKLIALLTTLKLLTQLTLFKQLWSPKAYRLYSYIAVRVSEQKNMMGNGLDWIPLELLYNY